MTSEELRRQRVRELGEKILIEIIKKWDGIVVYKDESCPAATTMVKTSLIIAEEFVKQAGIS